MPSTRQLAAIMFTDIVGYTALMGRDEQKAFAILNKNRLIHKPAIDAYHGRWIKELGDGVMVSFQTVSDAVNAAIKIQEACNTAKEFQLRIGIHLGEVIFENDDVFGDGVNIAARIQSAASPGSIYISEPVNQILYNKKDFHTRFAKEEHLKNVKDPVRLYEVLIDHAPVEKSEYPIAPTPKITDPSPNSIAVLPFANMSSDPEQEYFSDGITEDIITQISKINQLKVISRTSVIQFKNSQKSIPEIRSALKVSYLLEGSVRKAGNRLRIVAQLIDTMHDKHLWAETFDRDLTDIFVIQTEIAEKIANEIKGHLTEAEHLRLNEKPTTNMEAYNLYLLGKYHYNKATPEDRNLATNYLERAISLDPDFALAYATLAAVTMFQGVGYFGIRPHDVMPDAFKMANKAIQLDPDLSYAYLVRGEIYDWYFFEWDKANYDYRKAITLNPNNADAHLYYAVHLAAHRRLDEAIREKDIASDLDPFSAMIRLDGFWIMHVGGQTEKAFQEIYPGLILANDKINAGFCKAMYLVAMGRFEESVNEWRETFEAAKGSLADTFFRIFFAYGLARAGKHEQSRQTLAEIHALEDKEFVWPMGIALIYAHLGETSRALDYLEKSYEERTGWMLWIGCDPALDVLRKEPRFKELVRKIGPEEAIAEIDRFG